jgi:hypothetical protein
LLLLYALEHLVGLGRYLPWLRKSKALLVLGNVFDASLTVGGICAGNLINALADASVVLCSTVLAMTKNISL